LAKSLFFLRIKEDVLAVVASIPKARITTFLAIGEHLDVMPRHIAYILTTLEDDKKAILPWHRVVGDGGALCKPKLGADGISQAGLLTSEGIQLHDSAVVNMPIYFIAVEDLKSGVPKQTRPADAPTRVISS
jgi:methylated-DNA-protein-cysteine methyltransferase related protein